MDDRIPDIAAELAGHGRDAEAWALTMIRALEHDYDLTHAERWRATCRILDAMDLVYELRLRAGRGTDERG